MGTRWDRATLKPNSQGANRGRGEGTTAWWWMCETGPEDYRRWGTTGAGRGNEVVRGRKSQQGVSVGVCPGVCDGRVKKKL